MSKMATSLKYLGLCVLLAVPALIVLIIRPRESIERIKATHKSMRVEKSMRNLALAIERSGAIKVNGKVIK